MTLRNLLLIVGVGIPSFAQSFSSGSNGSDGALTYSTPGTYEFDPSALGKDPDGDNVFHFTTITIGPGVTVRLRNGPLRGAAVVWLATGAVLIEGTLDLSGEPGHTDVIAPAVRFPAQPGPGGYAGGLGGSTFGGGTGGLGPGGGILNFTYLANGSGGSHATAGWVHPFTSGVAAPTYGNPYLVPLRGGSGGAGGVSGSGTGGGGGGGAIRIASSLSINVPGAIRAVGGSGGAGSSPSKGGGGAGGAVHLIAPLLTGAGELVVGGGATGGNGRIRVDASQHLEAFSYAGALLAVGTPYNVPLPTGPPRIRVVSIGGVPVSLSPSGSFAVPDVVLSQTGPVSISIEARDVPLGTVAKLTLLSETDPDRVLDSAPLAGTVALSTATLSTTISIGYSRGFVRATW